MTQTGSFSRMEDELEGSRQKGQKIQAQGIVGMAAEDQLDSMPGTHPFATSTLQSGWAGSEVRWHAKSYQLRVSTSKDHECG